MGCNSTRLPLLLERVGVRRIKSTSYIPLIPAFSLKGEGAPTFVDIFATGGRGSKTFKLIHACSLTNREY
jgi:hypothetical protein